MKIYVASSWRTPRQPQVVDALRAWKHEVYDFRHPAPGNDGFHWSQVGPHWTREARLPAAEYIETLSSHPRCAEGFNFDLNALSAADGLVLVMPAGRSAHLELGYAVGAGKKTVILLEDPIDGPDLMHLCATKLAKSIPEVLAFFGNLCKHPNIQNDGELVDCPDCGVVFDTAMDKRARGELVERRPQS